jgi:sulfide:quinone oxidoreductase
MAEPRVVIAGGGVAGLEALLALRHLAGDAVRITLVAPEEHFVYRPLSTAEPFSRGHVTRHPLADIARDLAIELVADRVVGVDATGRAARLAEGDAVPFDSLLLAPGATQHAAFEHAITFGAPGSDEALHGLLRDLEEGYVKRAAFVAPPASSWTLPLYELALMSAREVWAQGFDDAQITLVSSEDRPLGIFGAGPTAALSELLENNRVRFLGGAAAEVERGLVRVHPAGESIEVDRVVALPALTGPRLEAVPADAGGFIPADAHGAVAGLDGVFAAGDATTFPVKQGGIAAQQADAAAQSIAARHGADVQPEPFEPVLRGQLYTGGDPRYLDSSGGKDGEISVQPLWWPPTKIAGSYLAPYLYGREQAEAMGEQPPAPGFERIEHRLH